MHDAANLDNASGASAVRGRASGAEGEGKGGLDDSEGNGEEEKSCGGGRAAPGEGKRRAGRRRPESAQRGRCSGSAAYVGAGCFLFLPSRRRLAVLMLNFIRVAASCQGRSARGPNADLLDRRMGRGGAGK